MKAENVKRGAVDTIKNFLGYLRPGVGKTLAPGERHASVGPLKDWERKRKFQIAFLRERGLEQQHYLADIGCGTLRGGIPLIEYLETGHYHGIEVRPEVLEEGRKELAESGLKHKEPVFAVSSDLSAYEPGVQFDYIWAFSVLMHMTDEKLGEALKFVTKHLKPGGVFFANAVIGDAPEKQWQGFPIVQRSLAFYAEACDEHGLACSDMGRVIDFDKTLLDPSPKSRDIQRMLRIERAGD